MKLGTLKAACSKYPSEKYDPSLNAFRLIVGGDCRFENDRHMQALLTWLRKWGCRQFKIKDETVAIKSLRSWQIDFGSDLPSNSASLTDASDSVLESAAGAYRSLLNCRASHAKTVGNTGASKILFGLRPNLFSPWDGQIRRAFAKRIGAAVWSTSMEAQASLYRAFLHQVRTELQDLVQDAAHLGLSPVEIPAAVGRPSSNIVKLLDEYHFVTRGVEEAI